MALKVDYVLKETGINLRRNITLTLATVITVAVVLTLVGSTLLINRGVNRADVRFRDNVQMVVYMDPKATQDQIDVVGKTLTESPQVRETNYLDHAAAFEEFNAIFAEEPELRSSIIAEDLPTNYKVTLRDGSFDVLESLSTQMEKQPGVREVARASEKVRQREESSRKVRNFMLVGAGIIGIAALVLIINSIRVAMFARRREIEVMKLVGATNWFIRVPFMFEALLQGAVGAAIGIGAVFISKAVVLPVFVETGGLFTNFEVTTADVWKTGVVMLIGGVLVGAIGSALAVRRFLDI